MKADLGTELQKLTLAKWLCQNITQLLISSNETHLNLPIVCILLDLTKPCINTFASIMMHRILDLRNCGLVVHPEDRLAHNCIQNFS